MTRRRSSAAKARLDRVVIDSIPPFTSRSQIESIVIGIVSYFQQENSIVQRALPPSPQYFSSIVPLDYLPTDEESRNLALYIKKAKKTMFEYLSLHQDLCRIAVSQIPMRHFKSNKRKNFYYQLLQIAFYSDSLDLFKLAVVDTAMPAAKTRKKTQAGTLIQFIDSPTKIPGFFIDPSAKTATFEHTLNDVPTATAFAASPTEVFVGKEGGFIRVVNVNSEAMQPPQYCLFRPSVSNEVYSLAWIKGYLWILTNTTIWQVNTLIPKVWTFINNKPRDLIPPMCTDGQFFYCVRFKNRYPEIHIFSFNGTDFIPERHIKLGTQIPAYQPEHKIPFATDGGLICFAVTNKKDTQFKTFSLASGKQIHDINDINLPQITCWCTRPFSNEHIALTPQNILLFSRQLQIPRWLLGLPWPTSADHNPVLNALELACFHGANFFQNGSCGDVGPLLSHYMAIGSDIGFRVVAQILLRTQTDNLKPTLQTVVEYYLKSENNLTMQRFCCFIFLACSNELTASVKPNIFGLYLENDNLDLDFIFLFSRSFNFKRTSLSEMAIKKLIVYVAERWNDFPNEASHIIVGFLNDYVVDMMRKDSYDSILEPISAIFRVITKNVSLVFLLKYNPENFTNSVQFTTWGFLLRAIMNSYKTWPKYAHIFIRMLKVAFCDQHLDQANCEKIRDMLNRTLLLLLELLLSVPQQFYDISFEAIDDFYNMFPHPMNKEYISVDAAILSLLNRSYDISNLDEYAYFFFQIRQTIVFEYCADTKLLTNIKLKSISAKGLYEYLSDKKHDIGMLMPIQDNGLIQWFFAEYGKAYNRLTTEQTIIISMFFDRFNRRINRYTIDLLGREAWDFESHYSFPFLISPKLFQQANIELPVSSIMSLKPDILHFGFNTIVEVFKQIKNSEKLLGPFLKYLPPTTRKPKYSNFSSIESEPERFKSVLLWLIYVTSGAPHINFSKYLEAFKIYIWSGSPRIIEAVMKGIVIIESKTNSDLKKLYKFIMSLISNYIAKFHSFFVMQSEQSETIVSLFIIIQHMKKIFNSKRGSFRAYIEGIAQKCKQSKAAAIFLILNNSLETVRKGVEIHFYSSEMIEVSGIVDDYSDGSIRIDGVQYALKTCTKVWCKCTQKVHISSITDFEVYANLFDRIIFEEYHLNVFKYSSLISFLKHKKFHKLLSHSFKNGYTKVPSPNFFQPENYLTDFFTALSLEMVRIPPLSFVNTEEVVSDQNISPILQNCILNGIDINSRCEGMLMTMGNDAKFISSPIHPLCAMMITLSLLPSEPSKQLPSLVVTVIGLSQLSLVMKSDSFKISSKIKDSVLVEVSFTPETSSFSVFIDKNLSCETAVPPSIDFLYLTIELLPAMIVEYKVQYDKKIHEIKTLPKCFEFEKSNVRLMKIARLPVSLPMSDSSVYNNCCLQQAAKYLMNCFNQIITMQILLYASRKQKPKANLQMRILASCNAFPNSEILDFSQFNLSNIFDNLGPIFHSFIMAFIQKPDNIKLNEYIVATQQLTQPYSQCIAMPSNNSALFIRSKQTFPVSNCFLFSTSMAPKVVGFSTDLFEFNSTCAIIPLSNFHGTIIDCLIYIRHLIGLFVLKKCYNFTQIYDIIDKITERNTTIKPLFTPLIELMNLVSPADLRNDASFLIKESIVHYDYGKFLIPKFAPAAIAPHVWPIPLPANFNIPNADLVYLKVNVPPPAFDILITTNHGHTKQVINSDSFAILETGEFSIKAVQKDFENALIEIHAYPIEVKTLPIHLNKWLPNHSHQILCSLSPEQSLTQDQYNLMPLSTIFSFSVALFVLLVLRDGRSNLFRFTSHLIKPIHPRSKVTFQRNLNMPIVDDVFTRSEDSPSNFVYCNIVADISMQTPQRMRYLKENKLTTLSMIDPDWIRINPEVSQYPVAIRLLKQHFEKAIKYSKGAKTVAEWLQAYIQRMPNFVVLMFIELVIGRWGTRALQSDTPDTIFVHSVQTIETIEAIQDEHLLIVGRFQNEQTFRFKLMRMMQEYNDSQYGSLV